MRGSAAPALDGDVVPWTAPGFARVASLVNARTGLSFPADRRDMAEAAIRRAMAHVSATDLDRFADRLARDPEVLTAALHELTVGETYFFRDPAQWELIRREIVPTLLARHPGGFGVRAWSAGCSSGEEPYTLGIVLRDAGCVDASVVGTDIDVQRLHRAERAVYTKWSLRGMDGPTSERLFRRTGQHFHLRPELRRAVRFLPLNLASPSSELGDALTRLDLILCRNVLIYLEPEAIVAVYERLVAALAEGGWLMVAASDPQPPATLPLDVVLTDAGLLYRKRAASEEGEGASARALPLASVLRAAIVDSASPVSAPTSPPAGRPAPASAPASAIAPPVPAPAPAAAGSHVTTAEIERAYRAAHYDRAIALAESVVAEGRDDAGVWVTIVRAHANRGDLARAVRACALGLARHPDAAELHRVDSTLAAQQERFGAAAEAARRALYLDRTLAAAQLALGVALVRVGDLDAAGRALRNAERGLAAQPADAIVPASDGARSFDLLAAARAHLELLDQRGSRAR